MERERWERYQRERESVCVYVCVCSRSAKRSRPFPFLNIYTDPGNDITALQNLFNVVRNPCPQTPLTDGTHRPIRLKLDIVHPIRIIPYGPFNRMARRPIINRLIKHNVPLTIIVAEAGFVKPPRRRVSRSGDDADRECRGVDADAFVYGGLVVPNWCVVCGAVGVGGEAAKVLVSEGEEEEVANAHVLVLVLRKEGEGGAGSTSQCR